MPQDRGFMRFIRLIRGQEQRQIGIRRNSQNFMGCSKLHATRVFPLCSPRTARGEHHLHPHGSRKMQ